MLRALDKTAERVARRGADRYDPDSAYGKVLLESGPIGREESAQEMEQRATLQKVRGRQPGTGPEGLALKALLKKATDQYAYGRASRDLDADWRRDLHTGGGDEQLAGFARPQRHSFSDTTKLQQASAMAGNKSLSGMFAPRGYTNPREADPRLSGQFRNEMQRRTAANPLDALRTRARAR